MKNYMDAAVDQEVDNKLFQRGWKMHFSHELVPFQRGWREQTGAAVHEDQGCIDAKDRFNGFILPGRVQKNQQSARRKSAEDDFATAVAQDSVGSVERQHRAGRESTGVLYWTQEHEGADH